MPSDVEREKSIAGAKNVLRKFHENKDRGHLVLARMFLNRYDSSAPLSTHFELLQCTNCDGRKFETTTVKEPFHESWRADQDGCVAYLNERLNSAALRLTYCCFPSKVHVPLFSMLSESAVAQWLQEQFGTESKTIMVQHSTYAVDKRYQIACYLVKTDRDPFKDLFPTILRL